ncbi:ABC transporter permease [Polycladidibacter stylochi]|uniref:ABC transporter permease n=1 Tax=Polycladidibacter stylochi TaxID=1807766 RepID=UPI0009EC24E1|nr:ABC transporter permease [Pseudovibrio stylochi]
MVKKTVSSDKRKDTRFSELEDRARSWQFFKVALHSKSFILGAALSFLIITLGVIAIFWLPHDISKLSVMNRFKAPSFVYLLGTDQYGRDIFSMLMSGARTSLIVSLFAVGIGMVIGVPLGLLAAGRRGIYDIIFMRFNDLIFAFPSVLIAILITSVYGQALINAVIAIGIFNIPVFVRVARGGALSLLGKEYLLAARLAGKGRLRITLEHVLPNIANLLIVQASIQLSMAILAEAGLSYLGLGAQPPLTSWGKMLNESQTMISFAPQLAILPGLAIVISVLGFNLMGDGLRDLLDPKLRRRVS